MRWEKGDVGEGESSDYRVLMRVHIGRENHIPKVLCVIDDRFTTVVSIDLS
jgi:hypothetical protein